MEKLFIRYRKWFQGLAPKPIKLQIPGWSGEQEEKVAQPWQCLPFIDASTHGLELIYPFEGEVRISMKNGKIQFEGDTEIANPDAPHTMMPLFLAFTQGYFSHTSCLDIQVPAGYVLRTEPHPRFYTDATGQAPCLVPGHIQSSWWPMIFFVVFKNPLPGQTIVFRKGEPYGQLVILPQKVRYDIQEMTEQEALERQKLAALIRQNAHKFAKPGGYDNLGYKALSALNAKNGPDAVREFLLSQEA